MLKKCYCRNDLDGIENEATFAACFKIEIYNMRHLLSKNNKSDY